jgi:hypothetical protein
MTLVTLSHLPRKPFRNFSKRCDSFGNVAFCAGSLRIVRLWKRKVNTLMPWKPCGSRAPRPSTLDCISLTSGRWDSNPRQLAWKANALPIELRPHSQADAASNSGSRSEWAWKGSPTAAIFTPELYSRPAKYARRIRPARQGQKVTRGKTARQVVHQPIAKPQTTLVGTGRQTTHRHATQRPGPGPYLGPIQYSVYSPR